MVEMYYKCMIVKRIDNNKLVTFPKPGEMYISQKEVGEKQKFLRSARNLYEAIDRIN